MKIEYNTVLFGATSSPFLAQRVVIQLASHESEHFPLASEILKKCTYIDDICASVKSKNIAKNTVTELLGIMKTAKFTLHKFASNKPEILEEVSLNHQLQVMDPKTSTSVLGILWDFATTDEISIKIKIKPFVKLTKRVALARVASFYDPLGLVGPIVMPAKFIIQEVWLRDRHLTSAELSAMWDKELPDDLAVEFRNWYNLLADAPSVKFPRYVGFDLEKQQEIYVFCDASKKGYGCAIYLRQINDDGTATFQLLLAKGRVARVEKGKCGEMVPHTIPRLELSAALLGAEQAGKVMSAFTLPADFPVTFFTDSEIVLAQISSHEIRDVFTENRLRKIRALTDRSKWKFVSTVDNVADIISRGSSFNDLPESWFKGPEIMRRADFVPENRFLGSPFVCPGNAPAFVAAHIRSLETIDHELSFLSKFASFAHTTKVMAQVMCAEKIWVDKAVYQKAVTALELWFAQLKIFRIVQASYYNKEIKTLLPKGVIQNGPLRTKNAFLDDQKVLRVATRV